MTEPRAYPPMLPVDVVVESEALDVAGSVVVEVPLTEVEPEMIDEKVISEVSLFRQAVARS